MSNKTDWKSLHDDADHLANECSRLEHCDLRDAALQKGIKEMEKTRLNDARDLVRQAMELLEEAKELLDPEWLKNSGMVEPSAGDALQASDLLRSMLKCHHMSGCSCHELRPITEKIAEREYVDEYALERWQKARPQ